MKRLFLMLICCSLLLFCGCIDAEHVPGDKAAATPTPLPEQSQTDAPIDAEYFFRDCDGRYSEFNQICYAEAPWDDSRSFSGQQDRLIEQNVIPSIPGYTDFHGSVYYDAQGDFYEIRFAWQNYSGTLPKHLSVGILPEKPEDFTGYDGYYTPDYSHMTATRLENVIVYTEAITDPEGIPSHMMVFTLPDGLYVQIEGSHSASYDATVALMYHFLEHGVHYELLTKEQGDQFTAYSDTDPERSGEDPYKNCRPCISGLPLYQTSGSEIVKNGELDYSLTLQYELTDAGMETVNWDVNLEPPYYAREINLGPLRELNEDILMAALTKNQGSVAFEVEEYTVGVYGYGAPNELLMAMIETLPDYRKEEAEYGYLFADNEGQAGDMPGICGTETPPSRDFSKHISTLMSENAIPVVRIGSSPTVKVEYQNEEPCHIRMKWQDGPDVILLPPGFREGYVYVVDETQCSSHTIDGFTVYADGTESSEKKALITTFPDGTTLQVVGDPRVSADVMGEVLQYFIENGINYDAYQMGKGDRYDCVAVDDLPDYFRHLIPETPENWHLGSVMLRTRDDVPILAELTYYHNGMALEWAILTESEYMKAEHLNTAVNDLEKLTAEDVAQHWGTETALAGTFHGGLYLRIQTYQDGLDEELYGMMQSIIK